MLRPDLADELCARIARDDQVRARLARDGALFTAGYHPEMEAVHRDNAAWLREIVDHVGWPGLAMVGEEAASAAWRILQHAIGEPALLRGLLPRLVGAAEQGEVSTAEVAMLEDRIRVYEGRPQRYGTQHDWDPTLTAMEPMVGVEDPDTLDARRAAVGLPPMVWRQPPPADEPPPADWPARQAELAAWARRCGWR